MRKLSFLAGLLLPLFLLSQQQAKNITYAGEKIGFWEHRPATYNSYGQTKYPLLIFLHGIGERGNGTSELWKVKRIAVPHYIEQGNPMKFYVNGKWHSFIVLSPQCPYKYSMWPTSYIDALINYAEKNLRVDKSRIYLAGLSMGGGGTWKYASASTSNAKRLAAIATSSAPPTMTNGCTIANAKLPLYAFHARDDRTVNVSSIYNAFNSILACKPAIKPITKVWPTGGHNIFDRAFDPGHTYQTPNVYEWMLRYTRGKDNDEIPQPAESPVPGKPGTANKAPVARAGSDNTIQKFWNYSPLLNGSLSKDADGWITSVAWTKVSGPSSYKILYPNRLQSKVQNLTGGRYVFRITVTDNKGASSSDQVMIIVNTPPVIKINGPQSVTLPVTWAFLQASPSIDPGGFISSFNWRQRSGPRATIVNPLRGNCNFYDLKAGTYVFRITATDANGGVAFKDVTLKVYPAKPKYSDDLQMATDTVISKEIPVADGKMNIYPNPATSVINIRLNSEKTGKASFSTYDITGRLFKTVLLTKDQVAQAINMDVSAFKAGTYIIVARVGDEIISTEQFIKQ